MFKRILLAMLLCAGLPVWAQSTITATVTDPDGTAWASLNGYNATYTITLVSSTGAPVPQGQAYRNDTGATVTNAFSGNMDGTGSLSQALVNNSNITPSGTKWNFRVCPAVSAGTCLSTTLAVSATASLSAQLSAAATAPRIGGGANSYAYADVEVSATPNNSYLNITTAVLRCYGPGWAACGGGGSSLLSQKVVYASKLSGVTGGVAVVPGSSATSTADSAAALNTALLGGNVDLEVDSGYALSTSLVLYSNTTVHCTAPQNGFIMQTSSNLPVLVNAHQNAPTTASGTGGYLPSNITDSDITVKGCAINPNSVQAVTGTLSGSAAHTISGSTGLFVTGVFFDGVNKLDFSSNEVYDSGVWATFFTNVTNVTVASNYLHQPLPLTHIKYTDGVHFIGPAQFVFVNNNRINAGDDSIALNAEDGNRTGLSGPAYVASQWPGVKWGPITDAQVENNSLDGSFYGLRIISNSELVDRVFVGNTSGRLCGNTGTLVAFSPTFGNGNMGKVTIDGWTVQTDGTCNDFTQPYNFILQANIANLQIKGLSVYNPGVNWPLFTQTSGNIGTLSIRDWDVNTQTSTFSNLFALNGGTIGKLAVSGLNWYDSVGTGNVLSGSVVPASATVSNYAGPNRLLASGFSPPNQNGDAFTNTYTTVPAAIHYWPMNEGSGSTFTDHIGTTNLAASNVTWSVTSGLGASSVAQFNGTSSFAQASGVDSTLNFNGTQPMTVAYWVNYTTEPTGGATIVGNLQTASSYQGWESGLVNQLGKLDYIVVGSITSNQMTAQTPASSLAAGTSALVVTTYSGSLGLSGTRVYVNGVSQTLTDSTGTLTSGSTSTSPLYVGARNNSTSFFNGALAYMRVWNVVLTPAQVSALYALGPQ